MNNETIKMTLPEGNFIAFAENSGQNSDLSKVDGIAYSGGAISQYWSSLKLVIDLAGMQVASQLPLLYNHQNDPEYRLGEITATIESGKVLVSGGIDKGTERGRFIVEAGRKFNWQLSIGAEIDPASLEEVKPDEQVTVNAQSMQGPFLLVRKTMLREVSVCAVGADPDTTLKIAASLNLSQVPSVTKPQEKTMNEEPKADEAVLTASLEAGEAVNAEPQTPAPVADEPAAEPEVKPEPVQAGLTAEQVNAMIEAKMNDIRTSEANRIEAIRAEAADYQDIANEAVKANWTVEQVKTIVAALDKQANSIKGTGMNIITKNNPVITQKNLEAALCLQRGINENSIMKSYKPEEIEAGEKLRGITLKELAIRCCEMEGKNTPVSFGNETIQAAFSTVSLPGILSNVANKVALQSFEAQPIIATRLCKAGDLNDFKVSERYRLTDVGDLEEVSKGGEIKHGTVSEDKAINQLKTYGKLFTITRQDFYNDDLGTFLNVPNAMGQRAACKIDQLFHTRLMANPTFTDGNALFSSAHNNYLTGTTSALTKEALEAARNKFLLATDSDGQPVNIAPKFILVPSCLDSTANTLVLSAAMTGGSTLAPAFNIISRYGLEVVSSPYLQNANYAGNSTTGWYLFGDPAQIDTFEIGYLQGRRVPVVEQAETDFNTLGMSFRVVFDLGVREQAYQGMVFSKGVA